MLLLLLLLFLLLLFQLLLLLLLLLPLFGLLLLLLLLLLLAVPDGTPNKRPASSIQIAPTQGRRTGRRRRRPCCCCPRLALSWPPTPGLRRRPGRMPPQSARGRGGGGAGPRSQLSGAPRKGRPGGIYKKVNKDTIGHQARNFSSIIFNYSMFFYFKKNPADTREINGPQSSREIREIYHYFGSKYAAFPTIFYSIWEARK